MSHEQFPPRLDELMARYLANRQWGSVVAHEVEAYEAVPAQAVDPRQAWDGACEAVTGIADVRKLSKMPTGWATLVAGLESYTGLPMAAGNFPQLVRDPLPLIKAKSLSTTMKSNSPVADVAGLSSFVETCTLSDEPSKWFLAVGLMRLAKRFDDADRVLKSKSVATGFQTAFANEEAALAWQRGDHATARKIWAKLPDTAATLFNRGMAELFSDNAKAAVPHLKAAVAKLPESSGWHHLGMLYSALAQSR